jgi:hypothetical protein
VKYELFVNGEWVEVTESVFKKWHGRKRMSAALGTMAAKVLDDYQD